MAQAPDSVDPKFADALKTDISGIYFSQVAHYTPEKIAEEFRKALRDRGLMADELFLQNLLFLVRKRDVRELHDDVARLAAGNGLPPAARVSALKTLYALGDERDRATVDYVLSQALAALVQSGQPPESSPYVPAADRVGGPRCLVALRRLEMDATARQRAAEQQTPGDHARISRLDKVRAGLEGQVYLLGRKQEVAAKSGAERAADLARLYLRRSAGLSCWAYRELVDPASAEAAAAVRGVIAREIPGFLPAAGLSPEERAKRELELRLRGTALLTSMRAPLTPEEDRLLRDNAGIIQARRKFYYPECDWEDVLDRT